MQGGFKEIAACGTAVVITPVKSITKGGQVRLSLLFQSVRSLDRVCSKFQDDASVLMLFSLLCAAEIPDSGRGRRADEALQQSARHSGRRPA